MSHNILGSKIWKSFDITKIFEVSNSTPYHKKDINIGKMEIPYVTRTALNNGWEKIVSYKKYETNPGNVISFGAESAKFFYQEYEYISGNKMYYLTNEYLNKYNGLFVVVVLQNSIKNAGFGYGKGLTGTRLKRRKIMLPIDDEKNPDWQFMEDYIKREKQKHIKNIIKILSKEL